MSESSQTSPERNVNVTLDGAPPTPEPRNTLPCPLCGTDLGVRQSRALKPYCVCISCGLQIFFRGKPGIRRLHTLLNRRVRLAGRPSLRASAAVSAFFRLEQLREQKRALEQKRELILEDEDLEHAILAIAHEIARVQRVLDHMSRPSKR